MIRKKSSKSKFVVFFSHHFKMIALLVAVIILVAGYFLLLGPKYKEVNEMGQAELDDRLQAYQTLEKHLADLKTMEKILEDMEKYDLERLDIILPKEKDLPGLFVQMERITEENNFVLLNIDFTEQSARYKGSGGQLDERIRKLNIGINVAGGNYASLIRFLDTLEYNFRLMDVRSLTFTPGEQAIYSITLTTYYLAN